MAQKISKALMRSKVNRDSTLLLQKRHARFSGGSETGSFAVPHAASAAALEGKVARLSPSKARQNKGLRQVIASAET